MKKQILIILIFLCFSPIYSNKIQTRLKVLSVFGISLPFLLRINSRPANTTSVKKDSITISKSKLSTIEEERIRLYSTLN